MPKNIKFLKEADPPSIEDILLLRTCMQVEQEFKPHILAKSIPFFLLWLTHYYFDNKSEVFDLDQVGVSDLFNNVVSTLFFELPIVVISYLFAYALLRWLAKQSSLSAHDYDDSSLSSTQVQNDLARYCHPDRDFFLQFDGHLLLLSLVMMFHNSNIITSGSVFEWLPFGYYLNFLPGISFYMINVMHVLCFGVSSQLAINASMQISGRQKLFQKISGNVLDLFEKIFTVRSSKDNPYLHWRYDKRNYYHCSWFYSDANFIILDLEKLGLSEKNNAFAIAIAFSQYAHLMGTKLIYSGDGKLFFEVIDRDKLETLKDSTTSNPKSKKKPSSAYHDLITKLTNEIEFTARALRLLDNLSSTLENELARSAGESVKPRIEIIIKLISDQIDPKALTLSYQISIDLSDKVFAENRKQLESALSAKLNSDFEIVQRDGCLVISTEKTPSDHSIEIIRSTVKSAVKPVKKSRPFTPHYPSAPCFKAPRKPVEKTSRESSNNGRDSRVKPNISETLSSQTSSNVVLTIRIGDKTFDGVKAKHLVPFINTRHGLKSGDSVKHPKFCFFNRDSKELKDLKASNKPLYRRSKGLVLQGKSGPHSQQGGIQKFGQAYQVRVGGAKNCIEGRVEAAQISYEDGSTEQAHVIHFSKVPKL